VLIAYLLPPIRADDFGYEEAFAKMVAPLMSASNGHNKAMIQQCLDNQLKTTTVVEQFIVPCDPQQNKCSGYVAIDDERKSIIVVFQGTEGFVQLLEQGFSFLTSMTDFAFGGKVISYYHDAFYTIWHSGMEATVTALKTANPSYGLIAAGHSLGGALVTVACSHMINTRLFAGSEIKLVTYGQPRTGNQDFATAVQNAVPYCYRVIHNKDIVPHLPPRLFGIQAYHHQFEVWYANDMSENQPYKVCDKGENSACSEGTLGTSTADHGVYFGIELSAWVTNGCV